MGMSISLKKDTTKTNIKHNNRKFNDKEKEQNSHIDFSRSNSNQYLVQKSLKELYKQEFGQAQADYNEKQNRNDRKIKNYYEQVKASKKTSLQQEMILQVGDSSQFQNNPENQRMANDVLKKWFDTFQERNPNLKIYNAVIHNDEASPHMHLNFVPVATGYKRGMEKQVSFDKA
ncbi:plasmid recombination protein, partial [Planococcus alpniumensis]|uniref:plasmid recombination protein n=1 Tax=Planococcus alpniumensis TaxID=2708345 RepID=UPI001B8BDE46